MTKEEAVKVVKEKLDYYERDKRLKAACEILIPELAESEDERTRKELLELIKHCYENGGYTLCTADYQKYSAYLENQKEQKPVEIDEYKIIKKHITKDVLSSEVYKRLKECGWFKECGWYVTDEKPVDDKAFEEWLNDQYNVHHRDGYITMDEREFKNWSRRIWNMHQQKHIECTSDSALQEIKASMANWRALSEHFKGKKENFYQYYGGKADGLQIALNYLGNGNEQPLKEYAPDSVQFDEGFKTGREVGFRKGVESVKQSAEWSEEDEEALDMCLDVIPKRWKTKSGILLTEWLKDKIHTQPKQEWSEESIGWDEDEAFACVTRAEKAVKSEEELQNAVTAEK